jgi:lipid-binding SYLF domain-containing protein
MPVNKLGIIFSGFLIFAVGLTTRVLASVQNQNQQTSMDRTVSKAKVRQIQTALKNAGFDPGPINGVMGAMMITTLRNYQSHNGLPVTGTITPETETALMAYAPATVSTGQNMPVTVRPNQIRRAQRALASLMYNPGRVNGVMTALTQQAIREFQLLNDLPVTGALDDSTMSAIELQWNGGMATQAFVPASQHNASMTPDRDAAKRISQASAVLRQLTATPDKGIPRELLERALAVAVIPQMMKSPSATGGQSGKGVVARRLDSDRWSAPAFIEIAGDSFGAPMGAATDLVLVFTAQSSLELLQQGSDLRMGVDAVVVAGPVGRDAAVNMNMETGIFAYSRTKGMLVGVSLDGAVLHVDKEKNEKVYVASAEMMDILNGNITMNTTVRPFVTTLEKVVPKKRSMENQ